ncbi:MAG: DNA polymerase I [Chloroflexi bacterium]|nr:DNA polymerase I [Chloroflexota bacterium]MDA1228144.1 DNA polymerase I [Chloroflexota bacterium]
MTTGTTKSMFKEKPLLILIDGHALVHRAFHAFRDPLNVRATGEEVTAVYGFLNTLLRTISEWSPTHCIVTFDVSAPTFRHKAFAAYKAHRPPTPPELRGQFGRVRQVVESFKIPILELEGFEADDILGTLAMQAEESEIETLILTGDSDILQLVSPWVRVLLSANANRTNVYDATAVKERYEGLGPEYVAEIKALQGDTSDNIPGVPKVGAKSAIRLLTAHGSVQGIYDHIDEVTPPSVQKSLRENKDLAFQCKMLTTIRRDAPVTLDLEAARFGNYDRAEVVDLMRELEFFSMVNRIPADGANSDNGEQLELMAMAEEERVPTEYTLVDTGAALDEMITSLSAADIFAFDTETTSLNAMQAELVGLSFSIEDAKGWYVPVGHEEGTQVPMQQVLDKLRPIFESHEIAKAAHNANYDLMILANYDIKVQNVTFDTMLAAHVSGRKVIGLKALALECLHEEMTEISELMGTGRKKITMDKVEIQKAADYATADADMTHRLMSIFEEELAQKDVRKLFDTVEMPLVPVLVDMQRTGVTIDSNMLADMSEELGAQLGEIQHNMYQVVGHEFNINSSQQLGDVLFNELRLPVTRRTQKGYSTDAAALEGLKEMLDLGKSEGVDPKSYEVLDHVLEYRQLSKIKSTYVDALPNLVNPKTGRIHTSYNQTGSATGRLSSNEPNVQNIPVRTELGRKVRNAFVAENAPAWTLLAADYSQIELRILAHMSEDERLLAAFHRGEDIHAATASSVFDVPIDGVTSDMRRIAKIMNFGVLYGLSAFGIRQQTGLSAEEGQRFIETYFGSYPGIRTYIDRTKEKVKADGYVETLLGRRRYIPEVRSTNGNIRNAGERMAINMPIQGTAADIIKIAMIAIQDRLEEKGLRSKMIIQVHDELIFEVPREELQQMREMVNELMPASMELAVPLDVALKTGDSWGQME